MGRVLRLFSELHVRKFSRIGKVRRVLLGDVRVLHQWEDQCFVVVDCEGCVYELHGIKLW